MDQLCFGLWDPPRRNNYTKVVKGEVNFQEKNCFVVKPFFMIQGQTNGQIDRTGQTLYLSTYPPEQRVKQQ